MEVKLVTTTPEIVISDCAKVCYATTTEKDLTQSLVHSHKHLAVLRFAFAVVSVKGISIACQNQLVRSKHLDFLVESKRYVDATKGEFEFIMPDVDGVSREKMEFFWIDVTRLYQELLDSGLKKEDARAILPLNTSTKVNIAGNLQSWMDAIRLRVSNKAQREIRLMFIEIWKQLAEAYPNVFIASMEINGKTLDEWITNG